MKQLTLCGVMSVLSVGNMFGQCPPSAPTGVNASDGTYCSGVYITWNPSAGAGMMSYEVYRDNFYVGWTFSTDFLDSGAYSNHSYAVYAISDECGSVSDPGYDTGYPAQSPGDPLWVCASQGTNCCPSLPCVTFCGCIFVTWSWVSGATGYTVYRDGTYLGNGLYGFLDCPGDTNWHSYTVCATNSCGSSPGLVGFSGYAAAAPSPPSGVSASDGIYSDHVRVSWRSASGATSYEVYRDGNMAGQTSNTNYDDYPGDTLRHSYTVKAETTSCTSDAGASDTGCAGLVLAAAGLGNQFVFSWSTNFAGFSLVWCTNLNVPKTNWVVATPSPVVVGGNYCVTNTMVGPAKFYCLRQLP